MRPQAAIAACTITATAASSLTDAWLAIAVPPVAMISATTASAAELSLPSTCGAGRPKSLTTTRAPRAANASACCLPSPPPAPVTTATLPAKFMLFLVVN